MTGWCLSIPDGREKKAFTLIELLVVSAIIALLAGMLVPAMGKVREKARSAVCLSNVRRLAIAGTLYVSDHGEFPPVRLKNNPDGTEHVNKYGRKEPRWQWFLDQGIGPVIDPKPYVANPGDTFGDNETRIMTNDYFTCPSLKGQYERDIRNGAYGYNYQYLGNSRTLADGSYANFPVGETQIQAPGATILIGDSRGGNIPHGKHSYTLDPPKLAASKGAVAFGPNGTSDGPIAHSPTEARHSDLANISFVDGHAEGLTLRELGYHVDAAGNPVANGAEADNRLWTGTARDEP